MSRSPGQKALLDAVRIQNNKAIGEVIERSSIDDLEWLIQMLQDQLEMTPHWVRNEDQLRDNQVWTQTVRTLAKEALHSKRITERKWTWIWSNLKGAPLVILAALLSALFTMLLQWHFQ